MVEKSQFTALNRIVSAPHLMAWSDANASVDAYNFSAVRAPSDVVRSVSSCPLLTDGFVKAGNPPSQERAARQVQAIWRGQRSRKHIYVNRLATGLIHVRIAGDARLFDRLGLSTSPTPHPSPLASETKKSIAQTRQLTYLAVDRRHYMGCVLADKHRLSHPGAFHANAAKQADAPGNAPALYSALPPTLVSKRPMAYINGGFFNYRHGASDDACEHASIGASACEDGGLPSLPLPDGYRHDYETLTFEDGSLLQLGPQLSVLGKPVFTEERQRDPKYDVKPGCSEETDPIIPGHLRHAAGKHPRAAISLPMAADSKADEGYTRVAIGIVKNRETDPDAGYTLTEWAAITARLDRLSSPPNTALNLDGGRSVAMGVTGLSERGGTDMRTAQCMIGRSVANFVGFVQRPSGNDAPPDQSAVRDSTPHTVADNNRRRG